MGEIQNRPFQLSFNASLKAGFRGSRVTSDGGLILVRELDEQLGFGALIVQHLTDSRGKNVQLGFADLLRQSVYSRLAGYEGLNVAERLSQDPPSGSSVRERSGSRRCAHFAVAEFRDRDTGRGREPREVGAAESGTGGESKMEIPV